MLVYHGHREKAGQWTPKKKIHDVRVALTSSISPVPYKVTRKVWALCRVRHKPGWQRTEVYYLLGG